MAVIRRIHELAAFGHRRTLIADATLLAQRPLRLMARFSSDLSFGQLSRQMWDENSALCALGP
jgi:hypothetical protein